MKNLSKTEELDILVFSYFFKYKNMKNNDLHNEMIWYNGN